MSMSRKDYEVIAKVFADFKGLVERTAERTGQTEGLIYERAAITSLASGLAVALQQTNPRFDCQRFIEACGVK